MYIVYKPLENGLWQFTWLNLDTGEFLIHYTTTPFLYMLEFHKTNWIFIYYTEF